VRTLILLLSALAAGCGDYYYHDYAYGEQIPAAVFIDMGKVRKVGPGLTALAQERAEFNATNNTPKAHTDLNKHVGAYGVMAENVGTADSWESMYAVWRASPLHAANMNASLKFVGYGEATCPATGQKCFVIIYASKDPWHDL
jgi:hypothetical protein